MSDDRSPDTTAIRAFAAGMRTSVGIRNELLTAQSHLLALCDALDAERAADAPKPPPKRASDREDGPLSDNNCAFLRENYGGAGGLSVYWGGRLFATLDAEREANAGMRRALELIGHWDCLNPPRSDLLADLPWLRKLVDSGLRAAEKAPETTEPTQWSCRCPSPHPPDVARCPVCKERHPEATETAQPAESPPPLQWHELANLATLLEEYLQHRPCHTGVTAHMLKRIQGLEKAEWARKERERAAEKASTR